MHGQRIGYVRVSSFDQNPERQLEHVPVGLLFSDKAFGKNRQRPELERLPDFARQGIALAKQRGASRGRKKSLSPEQAAQLRQRVQAGARKAPLARQFGISRETLYKYLSLSCLFSTSPIEHPGARAAASSHRRRSGRSRASAQ